jgi:hypothetical protein
MDVGFVKLTLDGFCGNGFQHKYAVLQSIAESSKQFLSLYDSIFVSVDFCPLLLFGEVVF